MKPFFKPFVGSDYHSGGIFGRKVMVLGDSHYCGEGCEGCGSTDAPCDCNHFTTKTLNEYLSPCSERKPWMNTYLKFERSLVGHETTRDERGRIWNSVLFYNYLQKALDAAREAVDGNLFKASSPAFLDVIDEYAPDLIIVWGKRLWAGLPSDRWKEGEEVQVDGYGVDNGWYRTKDGKPVRAICVYHPSSGYSWEYWFEVISLFL